MLICWPAYFSYLLFHLLVGYFLWLLSNCFFFFNNILQESKLNPSAKIFTPSVTNLRPLPTAVPNIVSPSQMLNNLPVMPVAASQLGTEMSSLASHVTVPSKLVPYNNIIATHTGLGTHYTRPVCSFNAFWILDAFFCSCMFIELIVLPFLLLHFTMFDCFI